MKNNKALKLGLIVAFLAYVGSSCKKKDDSTAPEPTITINIQSPVEGAVLHYGDTLHISADVTSPIETHGYEWHLKNKADDTILDSLDVHQHSKEFTIAGDYVNNVTDTTNAELEVVVELDHDGNETSKTVNITLYP